MTSYLYTGEVLEDEGLIPGFSSRNLTSMTIKPKAHMFVEEEGQHKHNKYVFGRVCRFVINIALINQLAIIFVI